MLYEGYDCVIEKPEMDDIFIAHYGVKGMKWRKHLKRAVNKLTAKKRKERYIASKIAEDVEDRRRKNGYTPGFNTATNLSESRKNAKKYGYVVGTKTRSDKNSSLGGNEYHEVSVGAYRDAKEAVRRKKYGLRRRGM